MKGDGEASCFSDIVDTSIPALQEYCHTLTVSSRERTARNFFAHLKTFVNSVKGYVQGIGDVTVADRTLLREKWESTPGQDDDEDAPYGAGWDNSDNPFDLPGFANLAGGGLFSMHKPAPKVDAYGEPVGVTLQLSKVRPHTLVLLILSSPLSQEFGKVVDETVLDLQKAFTVGLEDKCRVGAANVSLFSNSSVIQYSFSRQAASVAVATTDEFAASMHWASFRASTWPHMIFVLYSR